MRHPPKIDPRLIKVAQMVKDRDMAALAKITARQREIKTAIANLDSARDRLDQSTDNFAQISAHHQWLNQKRRALSIEAAQLAAQSQTAKATAARAVGRLDVLEKLLGKS